MQSTTGEHFPDDDDVIRNHVFSDNIRISECGCHVTVLDRSDVNILKNLIQYTRHSLSPERRAFSIVIKNLPEKSAFIMFGINARCFIGNQMWAVSNSLRYHSNDGGIFNGGTGEKSDHTFSKGDEVTCYVDQIGPGRSLCLFLKNGRLVYRQWVRLPPHLLYATIGFKGSPTALEVTWPSTGSCGDLTQKVKQDDLSQWLGYRHITHDPESRSFSLSEYDTQPREAFCITSPWPLSKSRSYFEVEISGVQDKAMMPCLGLRDSSVEKFRLPGWDLNSIGYHGDIGGIFHGSGETCAEKSAKARCVEGDRQGCGVLFPAGVSEEDTRSELQVIVYFTKNGAVIYHTGIMVPLWGFYPSIGFCVKGEWVRVDMDAKPPTFSKKETANMFKQSPSLSTVRHHPALVCTEGVDTSGHKVASVRIKENEAKMLTCQYIQTPLDCTNRYFSAKIVRLGTEESTVHVGLASPVFPLENAGLGKDTFSCCYETKGGFVITRGVTSYVGESEENDVLGVYLEHVSVTISTAIVLFSRNGRPVGRSRICTPCVDARPDEYEEEEYREFCSRNKRLLASIVMQKGPLEVQVNWPGTMVKAPEYQLNNVSTWVMTGDVAAKSEEVLTCRPEKSVPEIESYWQIAQSCLPFSKDGSSYLEVTLETGQLPSLCLTSYQPPRGVQPGTLESDHGVGYCCHQHRLSYRTDWKDCPEEMRCGPTDRVGVGVWYRDTADSEGRREQKVLVYFTRNGEVIQHTLANQPRGGYYPTLSFRREGRALRKIKYPVYNCVTVACTVRVEVPPSTPPLPPATLHQWTCELEGRTPDTQAEDSQIYQQLVSDVINYTDFIIAKQGSAATVQSNSSTPRSKSDSGRTSRKTVYISHVLSDKAKSCQILNGLSKFGYIVEMSLWQTADSTVLQSGGTDVDYVVACLSEQYYNSDSIVSELECLETMNAPVVPVVVQADTAWPPVGKVSEYQDMFLSGDKYRLEFTGDDIDATKVVRMLKCIENNTDPPTSSAQGHYKCQRTRTCLIL